MHSFRQRTGERFLSLVLVLCLLLGVSVGPENRIFAGDAQLVVKTFSEMTMEEKEKVLRGFRTDGAVPGFIEAGGTHWLNESLWYQKGCIVYGDTATVNALADTTGSPNFKDGQYRYWGFDVKGGLYGNDDFPRDSDTGTTAWTKDWLTVDEIAMDGTARGYIGLPAFSAGFTSAEKRRTAEEFLVQNPQWKNAGFGPEDLVDHFYFNAVISDSGLTQGQFIGVHRSRYNGRLYYQTFSLSVAYQTYVIPEDPPEEPEEPDPPGEDPQIPTASAICTLGLPKTTFEGHPVAAEDLSLYTVDGEIWSARRTLEEGLTANRFSLPKPGGSIHRKTPTLAEVVFDSGGDYPVNLRIFPSGNGDLEDEKIIAVQSTPHILHNLTGVAKQNRRQDLNVTVATHPQHPLVFFQVELMRESTEEKVTLNRGMGTLDNSQTIKTRPIESLSSDSYFLNSRLSFLTKNDTHAVYGYRITVEDDRGNRDEVFVEFPVAPDRPPEPKIDMASHFLREPLENRVCLWAKDATVTDGDQLQRTWSVREEGVWSEMEQLPGFVDSSFGTRQLVGWEKEGVGPFQVRLEVEDIWVEETLEEYVTAEDRKSGVALGEAQVINVAPVVSLSPLQRKRADILLLAGGKAADERFGKNQGLLEESLAAAGIDATIQRVSLAPDRPLLPSGETEALMEVKTPFGYNGGWSFYEKDNFLVDEHRLYKIDATWASPGADDDPEPPYTISCFDAMEDQILWTYSFGPDVFPVPNRGSFLAEDDQGTYLFLVGGGKSLVLDKETGNALRVLPFSMGRETFVSKNRLYTLKADGLYQIAAETGAVRRIYSGSIEGKARRIGGRIHFLSVDGISMFRGVFDPETEDLILESLRGNDADDGRTVYRSVGIDPVGRMIVSGIAPAGNGYGLSIRIFDRDNAMIHSQFKTGESAATYTVTPIPDAAGDFNYYALTWDSRSSSQYRVTAGVYGIENSYGEEVTISDSNGYPTESREVIYARELAGKPHVATGAYWTYILYTGSYGNGPVHGYPERTKVFVFDPEKGTAGIGSLGDISLDVATREYGRSSDVLAAIQTGNNHVGLINGSETVVTRWKQTPGEVIERYLKRYYTGTEELNLVALLDETEGGWFSDSALKEKVERDIADQNGRFVVVDSEMVETEGDGGLGAQLLGSEEDLLQNILSISVPEGGEGRLYRVAELEADTTYYVEYDIKTAEENPEDFLRLDFELEETVAEDQLLSGGYRVRRSFFDDFNDGQRSPFFTLQEGRISDGWYKGGTVYNRQGSDWSNRYFQDVSSLSFVVPPGEEGILSLDWMIQMDGSNQWTANLVNIDGREWQNLTPGSGSGRYTHPEFLSSGEHTLTFIARAYGGKITEAKTWIDNLRVDLVMPMGEGEGGSGTDEALLLESTGPFERVSGYRTVTGQVKAPPSVVEYRPQADAHVFGGPVGQDPYTRWTSTTAGKNAFSYDIPAGKTAVFTLLSTSSSPRIYNDRYYGVSYLYDSYQWTCYPGNRYPESAMNNIPGNYRISLPNLVGSKRFSQSSSAFRGAYGTYTRIDSALVDTPNAMTDAGRYVLHQEELLLEAKRFSGKGMVEFRLPEGDHQIQNLKIYSLRDGIRVYALKDAFVNRDGLNGWEIQGAEAAILRIGEPAEEPETLVYRKGELVEFDIHYSDYEGDPSKEEWYRYIHTPFNDGPHPLAAVILGEDGEPLEIRGIVNGKPVRRFDIDGKYTMEHWQKDNTTRPPAAEGNPEYDKSSNVVGVTFYVTGTASAPYIEWIGTDPGVVFDQTPYQIRVRVNDREKDELRLRTELYLKGEIQGAWTHAGLTAGPEGVYSEIRIPNPPLPHPGMYEVVCTVRDATGVGIDSHRFSVISSGRIEGQVFHTEQWDANRAYFNLHQCGAVVDHPMGLAAYRALSPPRKRGTNVFWGGERFLLRAAVAGEPEQVVAEIPGDGYRTVLQKSGELNAEGEAFYGGELWEASMGRRYGRTNPEEVTIRFTATYPGDVVKTDDVKVIVDSQIDYWLLHRLW